MDPARAWAALVIVVACLGTASPLVPELRGRKGDSFPLSWFPMFAKERPDVETPTYVFGVTDAEKRVKVDVSFWTSGGFNQGRNELTTTVKAGPDRLFELCEKIAQRVVKKNRKEHRKVTEVRVARAKFDRERYFTGDTSPTDERILTTCRVIR